MNTLESIIQWAEALPKWQSDAVRRLLTQDSITEADKQEILLIIKGEFGLNDASTTLPVPIPVEKGTVSSTPSEKTSISLKSISELKNINAIPDGSNINFGHKGITVIYGENGSGKSGYSRVLKRACRARDNNENLLPDVFGKENPGLPQASFKVCNEGCPDKTIKWVEGNIEDSDLTNVTVFDSRSARIIVNEKNQTQYLPYGSEVFESLVQVMDWIKLKLNEEKPKIEPIKYSEIPESTEAGQILQNIVADTETEKLAKFCKWTSENNQRLLELTKIVADLEVNDPEKTIRTIDALKKRLIVFKESLEGIYTTLSNDNLKKIRDKLLILTEAQKAFAISKDIDLSNEPLPGAGKSAWQIMFKAAKDYSTKSAYPDEEFPFVADGSKCVLCMQKLSDEGKNRLKRFNSFMKQELKMNLEKACLDFDKTSKEYLELKIPSQKRCEDILNEIRNYDEDLVNEISIYLTSSQKRHAQFLDVLNKKEVGSLSEIKNDPIKKLNNLAIKLENDITKLRKSSKPDELEKLKKEKAELCAHHKFHLEKENIQNYLKQLNRIKLYDLCINSVDVGSVTRKGKTLIVNAISPQMNKAFNEELNELGGDNLPLNIKSTASKGEALHQFELKGVSYSKINLIDVLSEGEQRVVALAGFLAELKLANHSCSIILDDPVTSLDHIYREKIAHRLIKESLSRQVIIFTHDIAFLLLLQEKAGEEGSVYFTSQTILSQNGVVGQCDMKLPWHAMGYKDRIKALREKNNELRELHRTKSSEYNNKASLLYSLMRETWEAVIEEVVLYKTVVRHGNEVQTQRLKCVEVTTEDYRKIDNGMSKCSKWMLGHDKSKTLSVNRPDPNEIDDDINILNTFATEANRKTQKLREERDAALAPLKAEIG